MKRQWDDAAEKDYEGNDCWRMLKKRIVKEKAVGES